MEDIMKEHRKHPLARFLAKFMLLDLFFDEEARPVFIYAIVSVIIGALLYSWLEGWSFFDSVYFVIITLTTIGYGDMYPTKQITKILTIFFALNGVVILLMLFDQIRRIRGPDKENQQSK